MRIGKISRIVAATSRWSIWDRNRSSFMRSPSGRRIQTWIGGVPRVEAGRPRAALLLGALGVCLAALSSACLAAEPAPLKTNQPFIKEILGRLQMDLGATYAGVKAVRFDVSTDWPLDLSIKLGSANDFSLERATHFLQLRLQELGIDYINIQPDSEAKLDVCTLLDVQIGVTLRPVVQLDSGEPLLVGSVNLGVARGHPRETKEGWCRYEYEFEVARVQQNFFLPKDSTREEIERALEPALLDGIDYLTSNLALADRKAMQRIREWSEVQ